MSIYKNRFDIEHLFEGIRNNNRASLAKALTLIESSNTSHQELAEQLIEKCMPFSGNSFRIGITGTPGVGKSSFIESFGIHIIEKYKKKLAVLAIDPSSTKNKGSILGDKTRMNNLSIHKEAFIRPSPSSGVLGGIGKATKEAIILCEAAGFDTLFIETVGVGQSETMVSQLTDFFLLLLLPGSGDDLQGVKRGIMEMADMLLVNKIDQYEKHLVSNSISHYKHGLHYLPENKNCWTPPVVGISAINKTNFDKLDDQITAFSDLTKNNGHFYSKRKDQAEYWLKNTIEKMLLNDFYSNTEVINQFEKLSNSVMTNKTTPFLAAKEIIKTYYKDQL